MSEEVAAPTGWQRARVREFATTRTGGTPSRTRPEFFGGTIPWVKSGELGDGLVTSCAETLTELGVASSSAKVFSKGTLCIALYGATVGKVGILGLDAATNQAVCGITLPPAIDTKYLFFFLLSIRRQLLAQAKGGAQPNISNDLVRDTFVPLAPTHEQRRIVEKIEELFSDLDAGVAALERVRAKLKRYRASVLNAAVTGKLTEAWRQQNPPTEPADKLLARILDDRRKTWEAEQLRKFAEAGKTPPRGWETKYEVPILPSAVDASDLPSSWQWASVDQLIETRTCNGISIKGSDSPPGVPALRLSAMSDSGFDYTKRRYIPIDDETARSLAIRAGDFFVCRGNGSLHLVGRGTLAQAVHEIVVFPDTMIRARFSGSAVRSQFVARVWQSHLVRRQIEKRAKTSAGIYKVSQREVEGIALPLPPLVEQAEIVAEVERRLSVLEAVESEVEHGLKRAARLRQAILKRAFEGKLVPQDPADKPVTLPSGDQQTTPTSKRQRGRMPRASTTLRRKHRQGIAFDRGAVISRIVSRLHKHPSFGRTENMKAVYLAEAHVGIDLELEPVREHYGPLDSAIYKIENLAKTKGWFTARKVGGMVRYAPGPNIDDRLRAADRIVGDKMPELNRLLDKLGGMDTDQAELFATAFAVWNDLLLDSLPLDEQAIIAGVHSWHPDKIAKFTPERIAKCLDWMRREQFVPKGTGPRSAVLAS